MNKLFIGLCLVILASWGFKSSKQNLQTATSRGRTLNGWTFDQANAAVLRFQEKPVNNFKKVNIWYSKGFIDSLFKVLSRENADGIRIYFARDSSLKPAIVMVATKTKPSVDTPGSKMQKDTFDLKTPDADLPKSRGFLDIGSARGAALYRNIACQESNCDPQSRSHIPCAEAGVRVRNFGTGKITSKSVWFETGVVGKIRDELAAAQTATRHADGVRIYFTKNPASGRHGFVLVTTYADGAAHQDYFDCHLKNDKFLSVDDRGQECPSFCEGGTWNYDKSR